MDNKQPDIGPEAALQAVRGAARVGQIRFSAHAEERCDERGATAEDVRRAVLTATTATWNPSDRTWQLVGGSDIDGNILTIVVTVEPTRVRVVTVF